jgi:hypothetical protein
MKEVIRKSLEQDLVTVVEKLIVGDYDRLDTDFEE